MQPGVRESSCPSGGASRSQAPASAAEPPHAIDRIPALAAQALGAAFAVLRLLDEETGTHRLIRGGRAEGRPAYAAAEERLAEITRDAGSPVLVRDLAADGRFPASDPDEAGSALCAPLASGGALLGTLSVFGGSATAPRFGERDLHLFSALAAQAAIAVENARLHAAAVHHGVQAEALLRSFQSVTSGLELHRILDRILEEAAHIADTPHVKIVLVEETAKEVRLAAARGGTEQTNFPALLGQTLSGSVAATGHPLFVADSQDAAQNPNADFDRARGFRTYLGLPIKGRQELLGVLTFNTTAPRRYSAADLRYLASFADQAAIAIENARLYNGSVTRERQLEALLRSTQSIMSGLDLEKTLRAIVREAAAISGAHVVRILLLDADGEQLRYGIGVGVPAEEDAQLVVRVGESFSGEVIATGRPVMVPDTRENPRLLFRGLSQKYGLVSYLGLPIVRSGTSIGVLMFNDMAVRAYSDTEIQILSAFASQAAIAIENAHLFQETERMALEELVRLRKISVLGEIGGAMQGTMQLESLLQVILTGVTYGGGLGFNRAILLLLDEARQHLVGRMGVGPSSGEEAARIWSALTSKRRPLAALIAERPGGGGERDLAAFDRLARSLVIPVTATDSLLVRTVLEARPFRVSEARRDPRVHPRWEGRLEVDELACVPLVAKGAAIGTLVVDNKFNGKPISDEDLDFLAVFANQAGLALENARVYGDLEEANRALRRSQHDLLQRERLAALGEMAAHVVHEIRNPLVAIGGFARRLTHRLSDREPEGQYAKIIAREVDRLERIVRDVRGLSRQVQLRRAETDLGALLRESLVLFAEKLAQQNVRTGLEVSGPPTPLQLDPVQIKQAVVNLIANALEAMPGGGLLTLEARAASPPDAGAGETWVLLSVGDTGGGIPEEMLPDIFNPFVTSKEAGTGLGLPVVQRIVRAHGGRVEVENRLGDGATFRLWLPAAPTSGGFDAGREVGR